MGGWLRLQTEYMSEHGYQKFTTWFDTEVWYPLGRPVGTTTYPGMMLTSAWIHRALNVRPPFPLAAARYTGSSSRWLTPCWWPQDFGYEMSLNDVCCYIPAWFGVLACVLTNLRRQQAASRRPCCAPASPDRDLVTHRRTLFTYGLAYEAFQSPNVAVTAAGIMSILPAHLMRSVGGGYDNESIAVAAIVGTFYFWCRSLRHDSSWPIGMLAGFAYIYMAAAWGGYTFVLNMIGVHAGVLLLTGNYTPKLHRAYTLFFAIGTAGAIHVPVVGWQPLQSLEQMGPLGIFVVLQVVAVADIAAYFLKLSSSSRTQLQLAMVMAGAAVAVAAFFAAMEAGYLGPVSARMRGLFIKHTKTGNPLVDSVAEHQATPTRAYWRYFHMAMYLGPIGLASLCLKNEPRTDAEWFMGLYTLVSWYFSGKMIRLLLLLAPAAACTAGKALCMIVSWSIGKIQKGSTGEGDNQEERAKAENRKRRLNERRVAELEGDTARLRELAMEDNDDDELPAEMQWGLAVLMLVLTLLCGQAYLWHCRRMAEALSEPQIVQRTRDPETHEITFIDDYRDTYKFLSEHTPKDARVLAWCAQHALPKPFCRETPAPYVALPGIGSALGRLRTFT